MAMEADKADEVALRVGAADQWMDCLHAHARQQDALDDRDARGALIALAEKLSVYQSEQGRRLLDRLEEIWTPYVTSEIWDGLGGPPLVIQRPRE
jgi:hypothetical protein